jgi:hypothetical protein
MRKQGSFFVALLFGVLAVGCGHAQLPPTQHTVVLNWGATTSGGTSPYKYVMSRYTLVSADNGKCPVVNTATPNYGPLNSASPVASLTYTDTSASGLTVCYTVQAVDSATPQATSGPSNVAGPFTVPTVPGTPVTLGGALTSSLDIKQPPLSTPLEGSGPVLMGKLTGRVR